MITSHNVNDDVQKQSRMTSLKSHPAFIKNALKYEEKN
jgi:hypothetical protein